MNEVKDTLSEKNSYSGEKLIDLIKNTFGQSKFEPLHNGGIYKLNTAIGELKLTVQGDDWSNSNKEIMLNGKIVQIEQDLTNKILKLLSDKQAVK
jgi:hypothetical protein